MARISSPAWIVAVVGALGLASCHHHDDMPCGNGICVCQQGQSCDIPCAAPPCSLVCAGDNPRCRGGCANGDCTCLGQSSCDFTCQAPPCHVTCAGPATCTGVCANGECTCEQGAQCQFTCGTPPCAVSCLGNNAVCAGECANGSCTCGPGSSCQFVCQTGPCHVSCAAGSTCTVECPAAGQAGTQNCIIDSCAAGTAVLCPGGTFTTCGAPCPS
jgi:hypothetical protein